MRLFVALDVPAEVRADVVTALDLVRGTAPDGLRWTDPTRWHLTLAFLGEVAEARVEALSARLSRAAARHAAPTLRVQGAGRFDGRVLWAGVHEAEPRSASASGSASSPSGLLRALATSVVAAARHTGIEVDDRPYRAHLTLARSAAPTDLRTLVAALGSLRSARWQPDAVSLVRSQLGPRPEHTVLASFPLAAPAA